MALRACFDNIVLPYKLKVYKCLKYKQLLPGTYVTLTTICNYRCICLLISYLLPHWEELQGIRQDLCHHPIYILLCGIDNKSVNIYINKNPG